VTTFDTTPDPRFLRALQTQSWTVHGALAELVDNSFGSAIPGKPGEPGRGDADQVHIVYDPRKRTLAVLDNGRGMDAIGRLFQLGNTIGRRAGDIGEYGSGGTMALLYLARAVSIWTLKDGIVSYDSVDWPRQIELREFPHISNDWHPATDVNTPEPLRELEHGTLIVMELAPERKFQASNVQRELARNYAPGVRLGKHLAWTTLGRGGGTQALADPLVLPDDPARTVEFDLTVVAGGQLLPVSGKIGLVIDLPYSQSRVAIGYGSRVIVYTRDCYDSPDKSAKFLGAGVAGWLDLGDGWQPYLTTTKNGINDQPLWEALMGHVFERIRPLLEQVEQDTLYLELEEIALDLQAALDGRTRVAVTRGPRTRPSGPSGPTDEGPAQPPGDDEEPPSDRDGDKPIDEPARARIEIQPVDDVDVDGALCKAELRGGGSILVQVNREHEIVQEALKAKPINRMALNVLTTREIAHELVKADELLELLFSKRVLLEIAEREEHDSQAQYVARLLIDRIRRPERAAA
jgi:hypothetical protein